MTGAYVDDGYDSDDDRRGEQELALLANADGGREAGARAEPAAGPRADCGEEDGDPLVAGLAAAPSFKSEARALLALAVPVSATRVLVGISRMTSLLFVGRLTSASSLAAASLAGSVSNVTGYSVMVSFIGGLSTMAGQAYGAKRYATVGYHLQCALLMTYSSALLLVTPLWLFSAPVLRLLGQNEMVSAEAAEYLQILIPSVFAFGSRQCIQVRARRPDGPSNAPTHALARALTFITTTRSFRRGRRRSAWCGPSR